MIHPLQLRELIVRPALQYIGLHSIAAENLLMLTAAAESGGGCFIKQHPAGPALGIFQMEPWVHDDLYQSFINHRPDLLDLVHSSVSRPLAETMIYDLRYAAIMARIKYRQDPQSLPSANDKQALAAYWKRVYNTHKGKGEVAKALAIYKKMEVYA